MNHAEVINGLQSLIRDIDREMDKLEATLREGERLRAELLRQAIALAWEEANDPLPLVRNDP